jgi:hypothetical protein
VSEYSVPAMPTVPTSKLYRGTPDLLLYYGPRHSLGWQDHRKAGPSFVVVRLGRSGGVKVISRFPLNELGWGSAWRKLSDLDADAAAAVRAQLATMEAARSATAALGALDAETVYCLPSMPYKGGSGDSPLTQGQHYDLRFLDDRLAICRSASVTPVVELPYPDVQAVEVSGSGPRMSPGEQTAVILFVGLIGGVIGLLILGLLGFFLGALLLGALAAVTTASSSKVQTTVRLSGRGIEFFFLNAWKAPDAIRVELSAPLAAIAAARTAPNSGSGEPAQRAPDSIPDQLSKLASLLADGVLSREEYERLKAKVIAQP